MTRRRIGRGVLTEGQKRQVIRQGGKKGGQHPQVVGAPSLGDLDRSRSAEQYQGLAGWAGRGRTRHRTTPNLSPPGYVDGRALAW
ncbi:hypothetical protein [Intestinimonas butyriciproducens]|uniref:hypothetical protein n=1 Tax=Intestinimonas butyriciproducens TaxID=1297617 RepID=UPI0026739387|nr:hypothetical protein [Intestinimonas butyriciproducens]